VSFGALIFSMIWGLSGGEFGVLTGFRRMEAERNVFARRAGFEQSVGDGAVSSVALNPYLAIDNVEMDC
jgi:hypothetical protein